MGEKGNNRKISENNGGAAVQHAAPKAEKQDEKGEQTDAEKKLDTANPKNDNVSDPQPVENENNKKKAPDPLPDSFVNEFAWYIKYKLQKRLCLPGFQMDFARKHFQSGLKQQQIICGLVDENESISDLPLYHGVPMFLVDELQKKHSSMTWGFVIRYYLEQLIKDSRLINLTPSQRHIFDKRLNRMKKDLCYNKRNASCIPNIRFQYQIQESSKDPKENKDIQESNRKEIRRFLFESAEDFCSKFVPEYNSGLFRRRKAAKWSADGMAFDRYRMLWNKKIEKAGEEAKPYKDYIEYVISVMKDANHWSGQHLKQWKSYKKRAIILPALAALLSAAAAAYTSESFLNLFKDKQDIVKIIQICFLLVSAVASCITAIENATKDSGNEPRETWLRQKHLYAKLDLETKRYLYNLGDYKITAENNTLTAQAAQPVQNGQPAQPAQTVPDEQKKQEKAMELLRLYVKKIGDLQKEDWSNFFTNMNCPNYDKEYFEKDE